MSLEYMQRKSEEDDRNKVLDVLNDVKVFPAIPGRKHINFPKFEGNPTRKLVLEDLKMWMKLKQKNYSAFKAVMHVCKNGDRFCFCNTYVHVFCMKYL